MPPRRKAEPVAAAPKPKRARVVEPTSGDEFIGDELEMQRIMAVMGIAGFATTKNKNHSASDCFGAVKLVKRTTKRMVRPKTG